MAVAPSCWPTFPSLLSVSRYAGRNGPWDGPADRRDTIPARILGAITGRKNLKYLGVLGAGAVMIYMYYVYIEAWCLGYAVNFMAGNLEFQSGDEASAFFGSFVGISDNGAAFGFGITQVGFFVAVFILNFFLIYRGLSRESNSANTRCPHNSSSRRSSEGDDAGNSRSWQSRSECLERPGYMWNPTKVLPKSRLSEAIGRKSER